MRESVFQKRFLDDVREMLPGCVVMKNDSSYLQGIPDWTILYGPRWATLEFKASANSREQPNQDWYVDHMNAMSFSAFVYPENADEVMRALEQALAP